MTLSTVNRSFERTGGGELFLAALPASTVFTAASSIDSFASLYYELFYEDGDSRKTLATGKKPYAALTSDGIKTKLKNNLVEVDPNSGPKHSVGIQDTSITGEITIIDITPQKLAELANCSTDELIATAAASGKAGRSTVAIGGQSQLVNYSAMYRMPSKLVPGEFDHIFFPKVAFTLDADLDLSKGKVLAVKFKFDALQEPYGCVNAAGIPVQMFYDIATVAATV